MYDINKDIIDSVDSAMKRGTRPSGWTVKTAAFLWEEAGPGPTRWFSPEEIHEVLNRQYNAEISGDALNKILEDALRTSQLGVSGGKYRVLR